MKKHLLLFSFLVLTFSVSYGQFNLYNTRTLYDTFENPSQKAFYADSSKKYAFNFFMPTLSINGTVTGEGQTSLKKLMYKETLDANGLTLGEEKLNKVSLNENTYLAMFRIFKSVKHHREMGIAWQIRSDTYGEVTNESIAIFHNYKLFNKSSYLNPFNNNATTLNYHQFSLNYREDINKRLGLGFKLSYLSGILHSKLRIDSSTLNINQAQDSYDLSLHGKFRSSISYNQTESKMLYPGLQNPGAAISLSANYKLRGGWYILGNLKDLGFIKWNKKNTFTYTFDDTITVPSASIPNSDERLITEIEDLFDQGSDYKSYTTLINGKAEMLISKDMGSYQPNLLISKKLFYKGADIALINRFKHRAMNFSLSTAYSQNNHFQIGGQFMLKSPNAEFFIGSDQLLNSYYTTKGALASDENIGKGNMAASVYFGFAVKFGPLMERQQNANNIPGIVSPVRSGFLYRLLN
ncbi:DUF5723 family protein [Pedobacter sp. P351]|uniref:DUF5723 family protein n=1 Tax=Pedobacter superstes TaxID=3133441 RepID=UPI0030A26717